MIAALTKWSQSYFVITVLIKCIIYEDCDHDRNPHKNVMFMRLYMSAPMIVAFFIKTAIMITVFKNMSYIWVFIRSQSSQNTLFLRTATMITVLTSRGPHKMIAVLLLRIAIMITVLIKFTIYEDRDHDRSPDILIAVLTKMSYFWVFIRTATIGVWSWSQYSQKYPIFESSWGLWPWLQSLQKS